MVGPLSQKIDSGIVIILLWRCRVSQRPKSVVRVSVCLMIGDLMTGIIQAATLRLGTFIMYRLQDAHACQVKSVQHVQAITGQLKHEPVN